jgi:hypothetical protein
MASRAEVAQLMSEGGNKTLAKHDPRLTAHEMQRRMLREFLK